MAIYSVESAMKHYGIRNGSVESLENKLLGKERFVGVITYYEFDFKTVDHIVIYTDRASFEKERSYCLEIDYPFRHNLVQDKDREKQRERFLV